MNKIKLLAYLNLCMLLIWPLNTCGRTGSSTPKYELTLKGTASGGTLVLANTRNRKQEFISIQTSLGESAKSVISRLADKINITHLKYEENNMHNGLWTGGYQASASDNTLTLAGGMGRYSLAGTESGLGIPRPPTSLSCSYDKDKEEVILRWINPPENYDSIILDRPRQRVLESASRKFNKFRD